MSTSAQLKSMDPRKAAMRILSMSASDRRQLIKEHFASANAAPITQNGVVWQVEGSYSSGTLQVTFTASSESASDYVASGWVSLVNGTGPNDPGLSCTLAGVDGLQVTSAPSSLVGITTYVAQQPSALAPVVVATLYASLASGGSSQITINISTASAAK